VLGATVWLVQQCDVGTRVPLLGKPDSGTRPNYSYPSIQSCRDTSVFRFIRLGEETSLGKLDA